MMRFTSMRARLMLVYLGLITLGFGSLTLWAGQQISDNTYTDFGNNLRLSALVLNDQLIEPLEYGREQQGQLILQSAANDLEVDIALFNRRGEYLYSTNDVEVPLQVEDNFIYRDGRVWASAPVNEDGDEFLGTVQLVVSDDIPQAVVQSRWLGLGGGFVTITILGLIASLWLIRSLTEPLNVLRQTALDMADGDLSHRVPELPTDEVDAVGHAFNRMAERVQAMLTEQRAFASNASHELRTPLTTIRLRTEAMLHDGLDMETQNEYIVDIDSEVKRMGRLVEDLLMLSRLDAQRTERGDEEIDVARLLHILQQKFYRRALAKHITIHWQLPEDPICVVANVNHVQVVCRNLIDNALKYTQAGGEITVRLSQADDALQIEVSDNGRGISPEEMPHIGKRFFRADKARSRQIEGTGLGLSLVQSILELYGGVLQLHSEGLEQGTRAMVRWPLAS